MDDYVPDVALLVRQIDVRLSAAKERRDVARADLFGRLDYGAPPDEIVGLAQAYRRSYGEHLALGAIKGQCDRLVWFPAQGVAGSPPDIVKAVLEIIAQYEQWDLWKPAAATGEEG